jgi:hypothetical protein
MAASAKGVVAYDRRIEVVDVVDLGGLEGNMAMRTSESLIREAEKF